MQEVLLRPIKLRALISHNIETMAEGVVGQADLFANNGFKARRSVGGRPCKRADLQQAPRPSRGNFENPSGGDRPHSAMCLRLPNLHSRHRHAQDEARREIRRQGSGAERLICALTGWASQTTCICLQQLA